jgi:hypothetical protein
MVVHWGRVDHLGVAVGREAVVGSFEVALPELEGDPKAQEFRSVEGRVRPLGRTWDLRVA